MKYLSCFTYSLFQCDRAVHCLSCLVHAKFFWILNWPMISSSRCLFSLCDTTWGYFLSAELCNWLKSLLTRSISDLTRYLILPQSWNQMSLFSVINLFAWRFRGYFSIPSVPSPEMWKFPQAQFSHKVKSGTLEVFLLMNFCCGNNNRTLFHSKH